VKPEYIWKSQIARYIREFLGIMRVTGYKYEIQELWLRQFDQYCFNHQVPEELLPKKVVEGFCYGNESETQSTHERRLLLLRNLAEYMDKSGCQVFMPPRPEKPFRYPKHRPYIYTEKELRNFFTQIDRWEQAPRSNRRMVDPLLFRMLYGCGLRLMEALKLTVGDVNLAEGILRIRQTKNKKDRFVPMSGRLVERCQEYSRIMHKLSTLDSYYFPGHHGGCYSKGAIYRRFREYLWKAGISHSGNGPTIHHLRHTYCVHRLKKWVLEGQELSNFLPYLAVYLGHTDFRGTEYYLRPTSIQR